MVGLSFVAGLSVEIVPYLYDRLPALSLPFFSSSLAVAAVTAILLNALFRLGISQRASLVIYPGSDSVDGLYRFLEEEGAGWGARRDVIHMANAALVEITETVRLRAKTPMNIAATFDEYNLDITVSYQGEPLCLSKERPDPED